jgi:YD repeat-containing protein
VTTESNYGGDAQTIPGDACGLTPPATPAYRFTHSYSGGVHAQTTVQVGTVLSTLDLTIDTSTGLPSSSRDATGKQTFFNYDTLGRVTRITPADDLLSTYSYCTATSTPACAGGVQAEIVAARKATASGAEVTAHEALRRSAVSSTSPRMPPRGRTRRALPAATLSAEDLRFRAGVAPGTSFLSLTPWAARARSVRQMQSHDVALSYQGCASSHAPSRSPPARARVSADHRNLRPLQSALRAWAQRHRDAV